MKIITKNYESLFSCDGIDFLFCGNNDAGQTVIGSWLDEDEKCTKYIYAIIEPYRLLSFKD